MDYSKKIIKKLLDKFEASKSFISANKINQSFNLYLAKEFPEYADESNYKAFEDINRAAADLTEKGLISSKLKKNNTYDKLVLKIENIERAYSFAGRKNKQDINKSLKDLLNSYIDKGDVILSKFAAKQIENIEKNMCPKYFSGNLSEYAEILECIYRIQKVDKETFIREFSISLFNNSKKFELIKEKVRNILFEYGEFNEKETVFEELNILKNPSYIYLKGNGTITIGDNQFSTSCFDGGIGLTSFDVAKIQEIKIEASKIITVENLTSFYNFSDNDYFVIYLGGFHNTLRRNFIKCVFDCNPDKEYYHFGDIDAGGFYILEHLKVKTGIYFKSLNMDIPTLVHYKKYWRSLSSNDVKRLKRLQNTEYADAIAFMLKNNCKLEQEIIAFKNEDK